MAFNHQEYNTTYLENSQAGNAPINDAAEKYNVIIAPADVQPGEKYWKAIGVHHLLPLENWSNHHVYIDALDQSGNRISQPIAWVGWTWEDRQPSEPARPVGVDKPDYEAGSNISIDKNQIVSLWINGRHPNAQAKSDKVINIRTTHPDEPLPDGSLHNTWGHHSFYVVFQETIKTETDQQTQSVIFGRLNNGQGQRIRLLRQDALIQETLLDSSAAFRFENLGAGIYTIEVKDAPVKRGGLQLDGQNSLEVNLAMPRPQTSAIYGTVIDGLGYSIILGKENAIIARKTLPPDGSFRFDDLPAGVYNLAVWNTPVKVSDISLDGQNSHKVSLTITEDIPTQQKSFDHYVLFGPINARGRKTNFFIAMSYLLHFSLPAGFSVEEAQQARRVTIIGEGISAGSVESIRQSGTEVELLVSGSYALEETLNQRIKDGKAFGE